MGKNFINSTTSNPFRGLSIFNKKKNMVNKKLNQRYKFEVTVGGVVGEKEVSVITGYRGKDEYDNTFILDRDNLDTLIDMLTEAKKELIRDKELLTQKEKLYHLLYHYIDHGYVNKVICKVLKDRQLPDGYNPDSFNIVQISVEFIDDLPEDDINLRFIFIDVVHIPIDSKGLTGFKKTLSHNNENVKVDIIGFDQYAEGQKAVKKAKRDLEKSIKDGSFYAADKVSMEDKLNYINSQLK